ncbi:MAG: hypothetical protein H0W72_14390 [Planctomycetes bacterium]|nr:hypothetical protein [Planctomycetota bacterium]
MKTKATVRKSGSQEVRKSQAGWLLLLALVAVVHAEDSGVQFSDGQAIVGAVTLAPGQSLRLHDGATLRDLPTERVVAIEFAPDTEAMEQGFRFPEPGQARKERIGEPYPVRKLAATARMTDGTTVRGTLNTAVVYVASGDELRKVVLASKQQGKPGETLASLVYPVRLAFGAAGGIAGRRLTVAAPRPFEVVVLQRGSLARSEAAVAGEGFVLPAALDLPCFLAARDQTGLVAGWPAEEDAPLRERLAKALSEDVQDYMDDRRLLGVWRPPGEDQAYTLLLLARAGSSTFDGPKPWRLEVWRWRLDPEDGRVMLAARGYSFRGTGELPTVRIDPAWWSPIAVPDGYEVTP